MKKYLALMLLTSLTISTVSANFNSSTQYSGSGGKTTTNTPVTKIEKNVIGKDGKVLESKEVQISQKKNINPSDLESGSGNLMGTVDNSGNTVVSPGITLDTGVVGNVNNLATLILKDKANVSKTFNFSEATSEVQIKDFFLKNYTGERISKEATGLMAQLTTDWKNVSEYKSNIENSNTPGKKEVLVALDNMLSRIESTKNMIQNLLNSYYSLKNFIARQSYGGSMKTSKSQITPNSNNTFSYGTMNYSNNGYSYQGSFNKPAGTSSAKTGKTKTTSSYKPATSQQVIAQKTTTAITQAQASWDCSSTQCSSIPLTKTEADAICYSQSRIAKASVWKDGNETTPEILPEASQYSGTKDAPAVTCKTLINYCNMSYTTYLGKTVGVGGQLTKNGSCTKNVEIPLLGLSLGYKTWTKGVLQ